VSSNALVIVESPAKAKTIEKYLGAGFHVLASYGHVRDLPAKNGSVLPDEDFAMSWEMGERADKPFSAIEKALKKADTLYLATDPDREGEAISWHVHEILRDKKLLSGKTVKRVTFNEITKTAIQAAFSQSRDVDQDLVDAYLARRALDYLVGFNLSPVLWRKLPGSRSAGRVQSVALRMICEREDEIEKFRADEYWSIAVKLHNVDGAPFFARLTHLSGNKLDKLDIPNKESADAAVARINNKSLRVTKIEKKQARRFPPPPFITSSLQMEASRKLGFSAATTMRLAQQLYEGIDIDGETVGLITYMRTDGITLGVEAIQSIRGTVKNIYGDKYVPDAPRVYKSKAKNAQEAHEAIRPTDVKRLPWILAKQFSDDRLGKLYDLIWKRTVASQMENAVLDQVAADISDGTDDVVLRANGSIINFDGFLKLYNEDRDDEPEGLEDETDDKERRLPPLAEGDVTKTIDIQPNQHFTQPPPRFTEASLVKRLEELGIGRPSTYASIIQVLQDRKYVVLDRKRFTPEDRGRLVTTFLVKFFKKFVDYDFTANLEDELDAISGGHVVWKEMLRQFWKDFSGAIDGTKDLKIRDVLDHLDAELGPHFFPVPTDGSDPRVCPLCKTGRLSLKLGKFGAFIGCSNYPECRNTRPLVVETQDGEGGETGGVDILAAGPKELGTDPLSGRTVSLRKGPYGPYVQIDVAAESKDKPKRQGLPRGLKPDEVNLAVALKLLELPRDVGAHPESGHMITAGIGRFGPFLKHDGKFKSIPKGDDVLTIGINRAVDLIAQAALNPPRGRFAKKKTDTAEPASTAKSKAKTKAPAKPKKSATSKSKKTDSAVKPKTEKKPAKPRSKAVKNDN
jgi:DNA topoisomerase I